MRYTIFRESRHLPQFYTQPVAMALAPIGRCHGKCQFSSNSPAAGTCRLMIDNLLDTMELPEKLTAASPFPARLTPDLQASLRGQNFGKRV